MQLGVSYMHALGRTGSQRAQQQRHLTNSRRGWTDDGYHTRAETEKAGAMVPAP